MPISRPSLPRNRGDGCCHERHRAASVGRSVPSAGSALKENAQGRDSQVALRKGQKRLKRLTRMVTAVAADSACQYSLPIRRDSRRLLSVSLERRSNSKCRSGGRIWTDVFGRKGTFSQCAAVFVFFSSGRQFLASLSRVPSSTATSACSVEKTRSVMSCPVPSRLNTKGRLASLLSACRFVYNQLTARLRVTRKVMDAVS